MKTSTTLFLGVLGAVALVPGCGVEADDPPAEHESAVTNGQGNTCENEQAVNALLANLAGAAALEIRRWLPERDFVFANGVLSLSPFGTARCPGRVCRQTQSWLSLQSFAAQGVIIGGQALDVGTLRARIAALWDRQMVCINRPDNHAADDCPVELHDLAFVSRTAGGPCGDDVRFHAFRAGTTSPLQFPQQLRNRLIWAGYPENPYLAFGVLGDDVKIDPIGDPPPPPPDPTAYWLEANSTTAPYCTRSIFVGSVSPQGVVATVGGKCQCLYGPQPVYTFKPALLVGYVKCKP